MEAPWSRMTTVASEKRWKWTPHAGLVGVLLLAGCTPQRRIEAVRTANERWGNMIIAVAPALNLSGAQDFDPNQFADTMASELSYVEGIAVVPVSRVLGVLAVQGMDTVESPEHALELVELLGADAIMVFAVTEYDPYDPPVVGISAQLYGARADAGGGAVDPVALSRQSGAAPGTSAPTRRRILARTQRVFDASHGAVEREIREFAEYRDAGGSPYGWRKFVVSQQDYFRFCCHATIRALVSGRDDPVLAASGRER